MKTVKAKKSKPNPFAKMGEGVERLFRTFCKVVGITRPEELFDSDGEWKIDYLAQMDAEYIWVRLLAQAAFESKGSADEFYNTMLRIQEFGFRGLFGSVFLGIEHARNS